MNFYMRAKLGLLILITISLMVIAYQAKLITEMLRHQTIAQITQSETLMDIYEEMLSGFTLQFVPDGPPPIQADPKEQTL